MPLEPYQPYQHYHQICLFFLSCQPDLYAFTKSEQRSPISLTHFPVLFTALFFCFWHSESILQILTWFRFFCLYLFFPSTSFFFLYALNLYCSFLLSLSNLPYVVVFMYVLIVPVGSLLSFAFSLFSCEKFRKTYCVLFPLSDSSLLKMWIWACNVWVLL